MNRCLPYFVSIPQQESYRSRRQKKRGAYAPPLFATLRCVFDLRKNRRRNQHPHPPKYGDKPHGHCHADQRARPHGANDGAIKPRAELLAKHSMVPLLVSKGARPEAMEGEIVIR